MNSKQLNKAIEKLEDNEQFIVRGLENTGKCIPYIGWYWRNVDFDSEYGITLGIIPVIRSWFDSNDHEWIGFMENNKWGYDSFRVKGEQQQKLRQMVEQAVIKPSNAKLQTLFDYMQSLKPNNGQG